MKRSLFWIILGLGLILSIPLLVYYINTDNVFSTKPDLDFNNQTTLLESKGVTNITLIFNYNDGVNITFNNITLIDGITAFNATVTAIGLENIDYYASANGVFIKGFRINGIWYKNDPNDRNWLYYVNGQLAGKSCSKLELQDNWAVEWIFTGGNPFSEDSEPENNFWLYTGIFIGIGAVCVVVVILLAKKGI